MTGDAVVVGAGHNGLVAANLLTDAGWDVTVLEAGVHPGGAVRSAAARGYLSDLCSAFYPLAVASPVIARLDLRRYGLRYQRDRCRRTARSASRRSDSRLRQCSNRSLTLVRAHRVGPP